MNSTNEHSRKLAALACSCGHITVVGSEPKGMSCSKCGDLLPAASDDFRLFERVDLNYVKEEENALVDIIESRFLYPDFPRNILFWSAGVLTSVTFACQWWLNTSGLNTLLACVCIPLGISFVAAWVREMSVARFERALTLQLNAFPKTCPQCHSSLSVLSAGEFTCPICQQALLAAKNTVIKKQDGRQKAWRETAEQILGQIPPYQFSKTELSMPTIIGVIISAVFIASNL